MRTKLTTSEKEYAILRKHWIVLVCPYACLLLALVLIVVYHDWLNETRSGQIASILLPAVFLLFAVVKTIDRRFNIWVITNTRIVAETGILSITMRESPVDKINNISVHQSLLGRVIGYGDVSIQTAAEFGETIFKKARAPRRFVDSVFAMQKAPTRSKPSCDDLRAPTE